MIVHPSVPAGQEMIVPDVVVVGCVLVVGCVVVVGSVAVVVGGGIVIVDSPVSVSSVTGGGVIGTVVGWLETPGEASLSSSVAASATIPPAARATRSSAPSAIQSQTGDSRDQTIVRV